MKLRVKTQNQGVSVIEINVTSQKTEVTFVMEKCLDQYL